LPLLFLFLTIGAADLAQAQGYADQAGNFRGRTSNTSFGPRAGYTSWDSLNQAHIGAHLKLREVFPNVNFTPNVEAGFGDSFTLVAFNGDLAYSFTEFVAYPWNLAAGGSLGLFYLNPDPGAADTQLGLSALIGLERSLANDHQVMFEIRVGLMDSPNLKFTFGYTLF
jgi:hypothetical protein